MCVCVQLLDPDLDLRTVKYSVWKSGGDMRLMYRVNAGTLADPPSTNDQASLGDTNTGRDSSSQSNGDKALDDEHAEASNINTNGKAQSS